MHLLHAPCKPGQQASCSVQDVALHLGCGADKARHLVCFSALTCEATLSPCAEEGIFEFEIFTNDSKPFQNFNASALPEHPAMNYIWLPPAPTCCLPCARMCLLVSPIQKWWGFSAPSMPLAL